MSGNGAEIENYNLKVMSKTELINYARHAADELNYVHRRLDVLTKSLNATHSHHKAPMPGCPSCDNTLLKLAEDIGKEL